MLKGNVEKKGSSTVGHTSIGELIAEAAADSRRWPQVLQALQQRLSVAGVALGEFDFAKRQGSIVHAVGYGTDQLRRYPVLCAHNIWLQQPERFTEGQILTCRNTVPANDLLENPFYKEFLEPQGFSHWLCAVLKREHDHILYLEAVRNRTTRPFDAEQATFVQGLIACMQQALQRNTFLWRLAIIQQVIDLVPFAMLAVNQDTKLLFANRVAHHILQDNPSIFLDQQTLRIAASHADTQLKALVAGIASGKDRSGGALIIRRGKDLCPLWLVIAPLSRPLRAVIGQEQHIALVFISAPEYLSTMAQTTLRTHFKLTPKEQELVLLILQGVNLTEAASALSISANTARTHMKKIYVKTKTDSQVDLIRLLLMGPLGL